MDCPYCYGRAMALPSRGAQRYRCRTPECARTFTVRPASPDYEPCMNQQRDDYPEDFNDDRSYPYD